VARRTRYVALLRGINLGARNKLAMADLRTLVTELGAEDVETYVQSGNVVFTSGSSAATLKRQIEERIRRDHGHEIAVLLRTRAELAKLVAGNPFPRAGKDPATLHVTFLADAPGRARIEAPGSGSCGVRSTSTARTATAARSSATRSSRRSSASWRRPATGGR
jgi:uncharacterized protein (DUF1697 family)